MAKIISTPTPADNTNAAAEALRPQAVEAFDALRYLASYGDLRAAFGLDTVAATAHYNNIGRAEGRVASFDALRYIASNPDLVITFGLNTEAATRHYIANGAAEGRSINFDALRYVASHADLIASIGLDTAAATRHYVQAGVAEGRAVNFDALRYLASNADLANNFGLDTAAATRHYITNGAAEGRSLSFNPLAYLAANADLRAAFGLDTARATEHYIANGRFESRSVTFQAQAYINSYPDLIAKYGTDTEAAMRHYISQGAPIEGRTIDLTGPTVSSVSIDSATGAVDGQLNAGDVISVKLAMSEATNVSGTPQLALNIGGATVKADYASGSGSNTLVFKYTVQAGQTDLNGISVDANSLSLNSGTLKDAPGNLATLTHAAVADNAGFKVDTTAPLAPATALAADTGANATDRITSNGQVNVTVEAGATWQFSTDGGANWTNGTGTSFTLAAGTYAADAVQTRQTDVAGNTGAITKLAAITVDATAPGAPESALASDTGSSTSDRITSNGQVNVALEAGATWQYSTNNGTTWTNGTGTSFTLAAGSYAADAVQTRQTDVAGNTGAITKLAAITVDATAPTAPAASLASDTGSSTTDRITSNGQVNVTLEAGATWQYSIDSSANWTNGTGTSFTLAAGSYAADAVQTRQSDVAGNTGAITKLAAITVDATAPGAPETALATDTGSSATDRITSSGQVNVAVEAGATWQFSTDSGTNWTNGTGTSFTLAAGSYAADAVQTRQTDVAGNTGAVSKLAAITVDATAPGAPEAVLATDTGSSATDRITNNGQVNVAVEAGATWQYSTDGGANWTTGTGTSFTLAAGSYAADAVQTRQTDVAGNTGAITKLAGITVDATAPVAPEAVLPTDTGSSATDRITSNGQVNVAVEAGATWQYSTDSGANWTNGTGSSFTLAAGSYAADAVQTRQTDVAGNTGAITKLAAITVDTTAPVAPEAVLATDTGSSATDRITSNGQVNVAVEAGATWQFSTDGGTNWTNGTGSSFTLAAGTYAADAVQTRQTDVAGNTGAVSKLAAITVDATAPGAPEAVLATDTGASTSDRITSNGQVNVALEAGATWQYSTNNGTTWTNGTGTSFTLAAGSYAADAVQTRQTDVAGNTGAVSKLAAITVDATAPGAPEAVLATDTGASTSDRITSNGQVNVAVEAGATWQYSTNNGTTWTNGTGTSFTLAAGSYAADAVQTRQTDVAGNTGAVSKLAAITVDATAPGAPEAVLATDTGSSATDRITNNGQVNVAVEAGATWQYSTDGGANWTNGTGSSFTLAAGTYAADAVQTRQTDVAGNTGAITKLAGITVDATAPGAPEAVLATDTGSSATDRITNNGQVNVAVEAGATWQYSTDGGANWTNGTGSSFTLDAGTYAADAVQTRQTDVAGNTGAISKLAAITVDATAPTAPVTALASDTGSSTTDRITNNGQVNVALEAGATWQYSTDGGANWTNGTGTSFALAAGTYAADAVQTRQTDVAGNTGSVTKLAAITVEATAPIAPETALASDTGSSATDRITSNGQVNVAVEAGATWQFSTDSGANWTTGTGTSFTLAAGSYAADAVQTRQTDVAGNTGAISKLAAITVDATAPVAPEAVLATDTGSSATDRITSNGQVNVAVEAGATWQYSTDSGANWTNGTGASFTLAAGSYAADAVQTRQTDVAGNTGAISKLAAITVDATAPTAPETALVSDTGSSTSDRITNNGQVNVALEAGATWQYSTDSGTNWTTGTGTSFKLAAGTYAADAVQTRQTDLAGNTGGITKLAAITVDTTAPTVPRNALAADTGRSTTDNVTNNGQIDVSGIEAGATWQYSTDSGTNWTNGTGTSFTLTAGSYAAGEVRMRQIDAAGNVSTVSGRAAMTVDTTAPTAPVTALATDTGSSTTDRITNNGQVNVALEAGATWQYSTDSGANWTNGTGTSFTLAAGSYAADAVQTRQTDLAGNTGAITKLAAITVDATAPTAPETALASDTGSSTTDRITNNGQVNVALEAGATWQYSTDSGANWTTGTGTSFTLAAGSYAAGAVRVRQTDAAGNVGTVSGLAALTVDTTAPTAPAASLATDTGSSTTDRVTSNGQVNVTLEAGATWQYSTNGGDSWTNGTGTSFTLAAGSYAADAVQTRQTDVAGNTSAITKLAAITVDATAPGAPAASLAADTGSSTTDRITSNGQVNVTVEAGATWQYSTNGGTTWTTGTGTSFTLAAGSYAAEAVQTRQTDVAGNTGAITKLAALTVDSTAPTSPTATRDGTTVTVAGLEAGATWEYSTNTGTTWTAGTGSSFSITAGTYAADAVQVRQRDVAGNDATAFKFAAFTITSSLELTTSTTDALNGGATADTINGAVTGSADTTTFHATDTVDGGAGVDTFNLTLSANSTAPFSLANVSNVEKYVITGTGAFDLSGTALNDVVTSVNASAHTGGLTLKLGTYQGITFTGGSGNDRITAGTALNASGKVDAGTGTDTLVLTNATSQLLTAGNPTAERWHGFEKLSVESGTADVSRLTNSTISAIEVNGTATVTGLTAAQALNLTVAKQGAPITFTPAGAGTADRLKISYDDGDATLDEAIVSISSLALSGVERLELVAKDRVDARNTTLDASNTLKSVTISGAGQVNYTTNKVTTDGFTVDASAATGAVTVNATSAGRSVTLTGGSGADSLVGSALADILTGGAGKDTLSGGTGADTFVFKTADIDTTAGVVTDEITDFAIGSDLVSLNFGVANAASFVKADAIDNSLADMLTLADQALNGTARYYLGQVGSDAYLVTDQDGIGYTDVIKLAGKSINDLSADMVALMEGFNDPLLRAQWYIKNVGQRATTAANVPATLLDLNVEKAWQQGFTGKGVRVGVSDDGIDLNHTDLQAALQKNLTKNFVNQATGATAYDTAGAFTPTAEQHSHGTVVGSIVAMSANNGTGMVGIAHGAQLVSTLVVDNRANPDGNFTYLKNSGVAVSVNSYGADPAFSENYYIAPGTADADLNANQKSYKEIEDAATTGRGGLGMVVEVSAGNERDNKADAGMTGFTNSRFIIASGSMDETGKFASYTSPGASVLVSAFGGENPSGTNQSVNTGYGAVSADVSANAGYNTTAGTAGNYAFQNTGTSYSGPMVGATAALMLQANPGLGFRDVSEILAITARGVGAASNNYVTTKTTDWNLGGMHFSRDVGFGLVDVSAAVHVAQSWLKVPGNPAGTAANWQKAEAASANASAAIPDNDATGLTVTANLTDNVRIERMEFDLKLNATSPSQLKAEITSAAGTTIVLFDQPLTLPTKNNTTGRFEGTEKAWPGVFQIGSTAFLGENSAGTWTLKLTDKLTGTVASYESLTVRAWGSAITDDSNYVFTNEFSGNKTLIDAAGNDTINAAALGTSVRIDLSAASATTIGSGTCSLSTGQIENAFGGMANDTLIGSTGANLLCGGWGADALTGGDGVDTFVCALGDASATDLTVVETITDYRAGGDSKIDFDVALSRATAIASAGAGMATIDAGGIASFNAADVTLAQRVSAVSQAMSQNEAAGRSAVWQQDGDAYLLVSDGVAGLGVKDALIKLTGEGSNLGLTIDANGDITSLTAAPPAPQPIMARSAATPQTVSTDEPSPASAGTDTLTLEGAGQVVDLGSLAQDWAASPQGLARVDITGNGDNTLSLQLHDVLDLGGRDIASIATGWSDASGLLATGGEGTAQHTQLVINADAGDQVQLDVGWALAGTVDHLHSYAVYNNGIAQLLIDQRATVTPLLP